MSAAAVALIFLASCGDLAAGRPSASASAIPPPASPVSALSPTGCVGFGDAAQVVRYHLAIDDIGSGAKRVTSAAGGWTLDVPTSWFVTEGAATGSGSSNATFQSFDPATPGLTPMHPPPGVSLVVRPYANVQSAPLGAVADEAAHEWPGQSALVARDAPLIAGQRAEHRVFAAKPGEGLNYQPGVALWVVPTLRPDLDLVLYAQPAELPQLATADAIVASLRVALPVVPNAISKSRAQVIAKDLADPSGTPVAGRRVEAKLVRYRDVAMAPQRTAASGITRLVRDPDELFWLVGTAGPSLGGTAPLGGPYFQFRAILHIVPASKDDLAGTWGMGIADADWPSSFDAFTDLCG